MFPAERLPVSVGRFVAVAALAALLPTQACGAGVAECTLDADCDQGLACEVSECVPVCNSDADCADDEACLRGLTTERRVCQVTDGGGNNAALLSAFALVRDTTPADACTSPDPGADLSFVLLESPDGDVAAWGRVVEEGVVTEQNEFSSWAHLNGERPAWGADSCPEFEVDRVVALGCSGFLVVEFVDEQGVQVSARSGEHRLRVGEFGEQCDSGSDSDRYEVFLCPQIENMDDLPDGCTVSVGVGQGERAFEF